MRDLLSEALRQSGAWGSWPEPIVVDAVDSTMRTMTTLAHDGAVEGQVVVARSQTAGRGRHGRTWVSALDQGVWLSILMRPTVPATTASTLPLVVGLAVADALGREWGLDVRLKWPNDVVVATMEGDSANTDWTKLAGVLAERIDDGGIIIGVGINVSQRRTDLPSGATSLVTYARKFSPAKPVDESPVSLIVQTAAAVLVEVSSAYRQWVSGAWMIDRYRQQCVTIGRKVQVEHIAMSQVRNERIQSAGTFTAVDVDAAGHLMVRDDCGAVHAVTAGDVTLTPSCPPGDAR